MEKLFGKLKMSWLAVILFAVIAGLYSGAIMLVPFLRNTSFQDIGTYYEWWVLFAVIIVVNCEKNWEAMLKCFLFFLISQPLIYAVQVLFGGLSFEKAFGDYYLKIWLPISLLTLPGGLIAYYCKKQNAVGAVILGLGNTIEAVMAVFYAGLTIQQFPYHLLSALFSAATVFVMTFSIQKEKKYRLISLLIPFLLVIAVAIWARMTGRTFI